MADNISDSVDDIGRGIDDFSKSTAQGSQSAAKLVNAYKAFLNAAESTGSAFMDANDNFKKYEKSVNDTAKFIAVSAKGIERYHIGSIIGGIVSVIGKLTNLVFEQNDLQLTAFDRSAKFGIAAGTTVEQLTGLTHAAGYSVAANDGFMKAISESNTALLNLGTNTTEGTKKLSEVVSNNDVIDEFMRLGYSQQSLAAMQTKYIKSQETLGFGLELDSGKLRAKTLDYVSSLTSMSIATGHNVDELAEKMAAVGMDFKMGSKLRELERTGNGKAAVSFKEAAIISATLLTPASAAGIRDFLANGTATTKEGKALLSVTGGRISEWTSQLQSGEIDAIEYNKRIAAARVSYEESNRKSLQVSKEYQEAVGVNVQDLDASRKIANMRSMEEIKAMTENTKKQVQLDKNNNLGLKETQIENFKTTNKASIAYEKTVQQIAGPVNSVFRTVADLVKQSALALMKTGNWMSGGTNKELQEAIAVMGDGKDLKNLKTTIKKNIGDTDKQIAAQRDEGTKTKAAMAAYEKAAEDAKKAKTPEERTQANRNLQAAQDALRQQKENERKKYGTDTIDLEEKKRKLAEQQARTEARAKLRGGNKPVGPTDSKDRQTAAGNKIDFQNGETNDAAHYGKLEPTFGGTINKLADRYYQLTGKNLSVNSSYRSEEEQAKIYEAWVKAGGSKKNPKAGGYYMPARSGSAHSSGRAIDIDASQLDFLEAKGILDELGLTRPHKQKDPVHVTPKAAMGGVFSGPNSGYNALLHGKEAKFPLDNGTVPIVMNSNSLSNFKDGKGDISRAESPQVAPPQTETTNDNSVFIDTLVSKLDDLNSEVEESNRIYSKIKLYSQN